MSNKLMQEWTEKDKAELVDEIRQRWGRPFIDIHAGGSRVFGGFSGYSDIDIIIWVREHGIKERVPDFIFHGIRISTYAETQPADGSLHRLCYIGSPHKPEGRDLTTYSLITGKLFPGRRADEEFQNELKRSLKENGGKCTCCPGKVWGLKE